MGLGNTQSRLSMMLLLTTIFFMVEIVVGYITNSMALIADSFHMFSDAIALVIAFISVRMSPKKWSKNTFGWARAEILGALVNAVFLCALCFSILIESIKRFIKPDVLHEPFLALVVGALGLFINLIGLVLFKDGGGHFHHHHHGHAHHHHNHIPIEENYLVCQGDNIETDPELQKMKYGLLCKHQSHTSSQDFFCNKADNSHTPSPDNHNDEGIENQPTILPHSGSKISDIENTCNQSSSNSKLAINLNSSKLNLNSTSENFSTVQRANSDIQLSYRQPNNPDYGSSIASHQVDATNHDHKHSKAKQHPTSGQMNMRGVFLHVMADALGSVIVMISAMVVIYTEWSIRLYIDPILSVLLVCLILRSTWPLLTESAMILLQTVPTHIQVDSLRQRLTQEIQGVLAVHEFHVWQLAGDRIIASAHIRCHNLQDYMRIAEKVKEFFHNEGIHSTTIQPEFIEFENEVFDESNDNCALDCPSTQRPHCAPQTCCGAQKSTSSDPTCVIQGEDHSGETELHRRKIIRLDQADARGDSANQPLTESADDSFQVISSNNAV